MIRFWSIYHIITNLHWQIPLYSFKQDLLLRLNPKKIIFKSEHFDNRIMNYNGKAGRAKGSQCIYFVSDSSEVIDLLFIFFTFMTLLLKSSDFSNFTYISGVRAWKIFIAFLDVLWTLPRKISNENFFRENLLSRNIFKPFLDLFWQKRP